MADRYIEETRERYRSARTRLNEIEADITQLQDEANKLQNILGAYSRILRNELGENTVKELNEEIDSVNSKASEIIAEALSEFDSIGITITEAIMAAVKKGGNEGVTTAQVISELERQGVGTERRNTIYGTLSRLKTIKRIRKTGSRFYTI